METKIIYLDSGVLIEYFRKKDKSKSKLFLLSQKYQIVKVSSITYYEILLGSNKNQIQFWNEFFEKFEVLSQKAEKCPMSGVGCPMKPLPTSFQNRVSACTELNLGNRFRMDGASKG